MKEKLPEAKEITIKLEINEAKKCFNYLSKSKKPEFKSVVSKLEESLGHNKFWNFLKECKYLDSERADFHLTGLGNPAWHLYCTHPKNENKQKVQSPFSEKYKNKKIAFCDSKSCPIYKEKNH